MTTGDDNVYHLQDLITERKEITTPYQRQINRDTKYIVGESKPPPVGGGRGGHPPLGGAGGGHGWESDEPPPIAREGWGCALGRVMGGGRSEGESQKERGIAVTARPVTARPLPTRPLPAMPHAREGVGLCVGAGVGVGGRGSGWAWEWVGVGVGGRGSGRAWLCPRKTQGTFLFTEFGYGDHGGRTPVILNGGYRLAL